MEAPVRWGWKCTGVSWETENFPVVPSSWASRDGSCCGRVVRTGDGNPVMTRAVCLCLSCSCEGRALRVPGALIPSQPAGGLILVHCSNALGSVKKALSLTFCIPVGCVKLETWWMSRGLTTQVQHLRHQRKRNPQPVLWAPQIWTGLVTVLARVWLCVASSLSIHACVGSPEPQHCHHYFSDRLSWLLGTLSHPCWLWHCCQSQKRGEAAGGTPTPPWQGWCRAAQPSCCQNLAVAFAGSVLVVGTSGGGGAGTGAIHHRWRSVRHRHLATARPRQVGLQKRGFLTEKWGSDWETHVSVSANVSVWGGGVGIGSWRCFCFASLWLQAVPWGDGAICSICTRV